MLITASVAASLVLAMHLGITDRLFVNESVDAPLRELVAAAGTTRVIEARLTGGFAYGPIKAPVRSGDSASDESSLDVRLALVRLERNAEESRERYLAALGAGFLAVADGDKGVLALEEASDSPTPSPRVLSNLAAGYIVRASQQRQPQDLARALSAAERATELEPRLAEAAFNRALALEHLFLRREARDAWNKYLALDHDSGWAEEARRHLEVLDRSLESESGDVERKLIDQAARGTYDRPLGDVVRQFPQPAREWVENELLVNWPKAYLRGDASSASQSVKRSRQIADILAAAQDDRFLQAAVVAVETAPTAEARASLARAQQLFGQGMALYEEDALLLDWLKPFEFAVGPLEEAHSPFAVWARLQLAIGAYSKSDLKSAARQVEPLIPIAEEGDFVRLLGLLYRMSGLVKGLQSAFPNQVVDYRRALSSFERVGDLESVAAIHSALAESLDVQGELQIGWRHRSQALAGLTHVRKFRRRQTILVSAVAACLRQGLPHTALYFQDAVLDISRRWNRPRPLAEAYLKRAEVRRQLALRDLAAQDLAEAEHWLGELRGDPSASRVRAAIQLAAGEVYERDRPEESIRALTDALDYFGKTGTTWVVVRAYLARGRAYVAAQRSDLGEADFLHGIQVFEEQRERIEEESLRLASFERPWDLFTEMIQLKVGEHKPIAALRFAEQARSRTLLEAVSGSRETPTNDPTVLRARLPRNVTVIYYVVTDSATFAWAVRQDRVEFFQSRIHGAELGRLVADARSTTVTARRQVDSLQRLYDELLRPAQPLLADSRTVVVVPDGALHMLPFAALRDSHTGRYLVEDHALALAPSLSVFLDLAHRSEQSAQTALVVGNPRLSEAEFRLPELPGAEQEARDVAQIYSRAELLIGADATRQRFLDLLDEYDVVHFAGHAIPDMTFPDLSRLLFAPMPDGSGESLFARDLKNWHLPRMQAAVLAACRTSTGQVRRGEGVISLARPFLAAGVPVVLATLGDLDDRQSGPLFVSFHRALRRGVSPFEALREAQLGVIKGLVPTSQPTSWASVVAIGGVAGVGRGN